VRTLLLCLIAIAALTNWWSRLPRRRPAARAVELVSKPATTILVTLLVLTSDAPTPQVVTAVVALVFCLAGDIALLGPPGLFLVGLVAFALAHVTFIVLFARFGLEHPPLAGIAILVGVLVAATIGRVILLSARDRQSSLAVPVGIYLTVILTMAAVGWATGRAWVLVGTTAFVVSDALIGWDSFVRPQRWHPLAIMVTYHVAIVSLALAV
jgi:uncharacterized membrane protein YhhN